MATVSELRPGDVITGPLGILTATFVSATPHPLYQTLQLVTWRLSDGAWALDALAAEQQVGEPEPATEDERREALRRVLLGAGL